MNKTSGTIAVIGSETDMQKAPKTPSKAKRTRWIAERVLVRSDAVGGRVFVRLGIPEIDHPYTNWRCPFIIEGLGDDSIRFGRGDDTMYALQNALIGIRCILEQSGVPLRCEGFPEDITGFHKEVPSDFGLAFEQKIVKMIDTEIEELVRPIRERQERREARRKARTKPQPK